MWHGRTLGIDLCPRLKALSDRHLYLFRGSEIPEILKPICRATLDLTDIAVHWDEFVRLAASVASGFCSAVDVLRHFGAARRGVALYDAGVQGGWLLRTLFLCDYFVKPGFRRKLLRVLNRGEATNTLKRAIYIGRVAAYQAKREEKMQAVADALSLLAHIVMAGNTAQMQRIVGHETVPRALIGTSPPRISKASACAGSFACRSSNMPNPYCRPPCATRWNNGRNTRLRRGSDECPHGFTMRPDHLSVTGALVRPTMRYCIKNKGTPLIDML